MSTQQMSTKRILIIDDEETIQTVVQFGIKLAAGWDVLTAGSGAQGIQTAQVETPDVILLDVMMPEMDGIATFKALRSHPETEQIPVILLTAKAQTAEQRQFNTLEVSGVITKPFNALHLPAQLLGFSIGSVVKPQKGKMNTKPTSSDRNPNGSSITACKKPKHARFTPKFGNDGDRH